MEPGELRSMRDPVDWYPKGKEIFLPTKKRLEQAGGLRVAGFPDRLRVEAWYCRTCNRLTIFNAK